MTREIPTQSIYVSRGLKETLSGHNVGLCNLTSLWDKVSVLSALICGISDEKCQSVASLQAALSFRILNLGFNFAL